MINEPIATITYYPVVAKIYKTISGIDDSIIVTVDNVLSSNKNKPRKYRLYHSARKGPYFRKDGVRFYLNDSIRINI